ncbi:MAG: hypothetical protein V1663_01730 [archaeon]
MAIIRKYEYEIKEDKEDSKHQVLNLYERWLCQSQPYVFGGNMCNDVLRFRTQVQLTPYQGDLEKAIHRAVVILYEGDFHSGVEYTAIDIQGKLPEIKGKLTEQPQFKQDPNMLEITSRIEAE